MTAPAGRSLAYLAAERPKSASCFCLAAPAARLDFPRTTQITALCLFFASIYSIIKLNLILTNKLIFVALSQNVCFVNIFPAVDTHLTKYYFRDSHPVSHFHLLT